MREMSINGSRNATIVFENFILSWFPHVHVKIPNSSELKNVNLAFVNFIVPATVTLQNSPLHDINTKEAGHVSQLKTAFCVYANLGCLPLFGSPVRKFSLPRPI